MRLPWFIWTSLASVTCILIGVYWDISWHMSIGRDSFWTPAHIAIQLGGIVSGVSGTYLILSTTFGAGALRDVSIRVWGFRGPLGAFLGVWGSSTMLISAPFDNWWHSAYGLDVRILSPPHVVLTVGILGVSGGSVLQILGALNRATGMVRERLELALLGVVGFVLTLGMTSILEFTFRSNLHGASAYAAMAIVVPFVVLPFARVSQRRFAATTVVATYTTFMIVCVWLFPLFPAQAKLGPVYQPITHLIPLQFPPLVIAPAFVWDLLLSRTRSWPRWRLAPVLGIAFVATLVAVEWPFVDFMMSEHARNWMFGAHYHPYMMQPGWYEAEYEFMPDPQLAVGLLKAAGIAIAMSALGLVIGDAMRKVKR